MADRRARSIGAVDVGAAYAAVVPAGGAARRLSGRAKPLLPVGGRPMLHRVLAAVVDARPVVVVGPPDLPVPPGVRLTREEPPGGGPLAALAAGLALVPASVPWVALLAADLPFLTAPAVAALREAAVGHAGAVYVDRDGRPQWLCGWWRTDALRAALPAQPAGGGLGQVLAGLAPVRITAAADPPPWYDCDTEDDLVTAERLATTDRLVAEHRPTGRPARARAAVRAVTGEGSRMTDWTDAVCAELGLDPADVRRALVLDLTREVAHGVDRPEAPVTAYLLGVAVGRGADPEQAAAALTRLARSWPPAAPTG